MGNAFDRASTALFGNADLAVLATYYPTGNMAAGVQIHVILSRADQDADFSEARLRGFQTMVTVQVAEAPEFARGDVLVVGADVFTVAESPERDAAHTVWRASVSRVS